MIYRRLFNNVVAYDHFLVHEPVTVTLRVDRCHVVYRKLMCKDGCAILAYSVCDEDNTPLINV